MHVQRYRAFLATFLSLVPSLMPYLGTIFCVMCIYCSLGVQVSCLHLRRCFCLGPLPISNSHGFLASFKLKIKNGGHSYSPSFNILSCPKFSLHFQLSFHLIDWWCFQTDNVNLCTLDIDEDFSLLLYQNWCSALNSSFSPLFSVQIFGGIVHAGNPKLDGTDLDENEYPMPFRKIIIFFISSCLLCNIRSVPIFWISILGCPKE